MRPFEVAICGLWSRAICRWPRQSGQMRYEQAHAHAQWHSHRLIGQTNETWFVDVQIDAVFARELHSGRREHVRINNARPPCARQAWADFGQMITSQTQIRCYSTTIYNVCMYESICNAPLLQPKQSRVSGRIITKFSGGLMASAEREPIMGVWGQCIVL